VGIDIPNARQQHQKQSRRVSSGALARELRPIRDQGVTTLTTPGRADPLTVHTTAPLRSQEIRRRGARASDALGAVEALQQHDGGRGAGADRVLAHVVGVVAEADGLVQDAADGDGGREAVDELGAVGRAEARDKNPVAGRVGAVARPCLVGVGVETARNAEGGYKGGVDGEGDVVAIVASIAAVAAVAVTGRAIVHDGALKDRCGEAGRGREEGEKGSGEVAHYGRVKSQNYGPAVVWKTVCTERKKTTGDLALSDRRESEGVVTGAPCCLIEVRLPPFRRGGSEVVAGERRMFDACSEDGEGKEGEVLASRPAPAWLPFCSMEDLRRGNRRGSPPRFTPLYKAARSRKPSDPIP